MTDYTKIPIGWIEDYVKNRLDVNESLYLDENYNLACSWTSLVEQEIENMVEDYLTYEVKDEGNSST